MAAPSLAVDLPDPSILQDILNHSQAAIVSLRFFADRTWEYLYFSPGCERLYGYAIAAFEQDPNFWTSKVHVEDRSLLETVIQNRITVSSAFVIEFRFHCGDDQIRWISSHYSIRPEVPGQTWIVTIFNLDISDRKLVEEALSDRNQELHAMLAAFPDFMFRVRGDGTLLECQTSHVEDLYAAPDDFIGKNLNNILPPDVAPAIQAGIDQALDQQSLTTVDYCLIVGEEPRYFEGRIVPIDQVTVLFLARNITEQTHLENTLKTSQQKYATLFNILPVGIAITDAQGAIVEVNPTMETMMGRSAATVVNCRCGDEPWPLIRPDGSPLPPSDYVGAQSLRENRTVADVELGLRRGDGQVRWLTVTATPIPLADYGVVIVCRDITESRENARALAVSEARFRRVLEQMPLWAVMLDAQGQILLANQTLLTATGWQAAEVLGGNWFQRFLPAAIRGEVFQMFKTAQTPETYPETYENEVVTRSGDRCLIAWKNIVFYDSAGQFQWVASLGEDITERRQWELNLQASEERLRMALEGANMGSWDWNLQTGQVVWSESLERLMGFAPGSFDQRIETVLPLMHPDDRDRTAAAIQASIDHGIPYDLEFRFFRQDGSVRWAAGRGRVVRNEQGVPVRFVGVDVDITDRKWAEAERDRLFNISADGLCITALDGVLKQVNPAFCAMLGYPAEDLRDRPFTDFIVAEDLPPTLAVLTQVQQGATVQQLENRYRRRDGHHCWLSWTVVPFLQEGLIYCSVRDVTQSKRTAEILYQYQRMVSATPDGMALVAPDYTYRVVNRSYCENLQRTEADLVGQPIAQILGDDLFETISRPRLERALAGQQENYQGWVDACQGKRQFLGITYAPYYDSAGAITGVVVTTRDLTDLKRAEIALQKQAERETVLARITSSLQETFDLHKILADAVDTIRTYFEADRALVYQLQADGSGQVVAESSGAGIASMAAVTLDDACLAEPHRIQAYRNGKVQNIANVATASLVPCYLAMLQRYQVQANLVVPILEGKELWGLLGIQQCDRPRHWQGEDIDLLQQLSQKLTLAIRQTQLYESLQSTNQTLAYLANHDGLTKIPNRRYFMETLAQEWRRAIRHQQPVTLILCDVDYFKRYNDTYGHVLGDRCLTRVASILQQSIRRPADMVARYGGEEFVILLPNTTCEGAIAVVKTIQAGFHAAALPHRMSLVSDQVTLSFGVACHIPQAQDISRSLLQRADIALYEAKQNGRNQYHLAAANGDGLVSLSEQED